MELDVVLEKILKYILFIGNHFILGGNMLKTCFKCGETKDVDEFYRHPRMSDGRLGKCKSCTKKDVELNIKRKKKDPIWLKKEAARCREKSKRLGKPASSNNSLRGKKYKERYPEKYYCKMLAHRLPCLDGHNLHHWSYNSEHAKDVIMLSIEDHAKVHRYMNYDQERKMYRTLGGVLIDSREAAEKYYQIAIKMATDDDLSYARKQFRYNG
jgi:hypothetical protein